jgi:hypothetical protein
MNAEPHNNDFVISLSGANIDLTIVNIEEMTNYCSLRDRFANVVTEKQTYGELDKLNYSLIFNYKNPKPPRVINTKNKPYLHVYNILGEKYHGGLLIAESDTISDPISDDLCKNERWKNNDIDLMICRSFASVTLDEIKRATLLRISADPDFNVSIMIERKIGDVLKGAVGATLLAQLFVNDNYTKVEQYMDEQQKKYEGSDVTEYIDYYELRRQLAYFLYVDIKSGKIIGLDKNHVIEFLKKMPKDQLPVPEDKFDVFAQYITV